MNNLTEDENFILNHTMLWGSDGYPVRKLSGGHWVVEGIRGRGRFPILYKTKKAAFAAWESFLSTLCDRAAGRLAYESGREDENFMEVQYVTDSKKS